MDCCGSHYNRGDRVRCAITGMEYGTAGVDCRTHHHAALCISHICFFLISLQLLQITRSSIRTGQKSLLPRS
ncbi:hypothetical protein U1Q18_000216, partial [Sarracenia purpurea var. burkii]